MEEKKTLSPVELARLSGKHLATVYRRAEKLGRLPTLEELKEKKHSPGRPKKYKY